MRETEAYLEVEQMLYQSADGRVFTQRSPVMPDVWIHYGVDGAGPQDLLLVAHRDKSGPSLAAELESRLVGGPVDKYRARIDAEIAPTQSTVAAKLTFEQLMRLALPMSPWWRRYLCSRGEDLSLRLADQAGSQQLRGALDGALRGSNRSVNNDLVWLARVAGSIALLQRAFQMGLAGVDKGEFDAWRQANLKAPDEVLDAFFALFSGVQEAEDERLWAVHRNRRADTAIRESTATIKADAARQVFDVTGKKICWAVLDTGIDARHIAFRRRRGDEWVWSTAPFHLTPPPRAPEIATNGQPAPSNLTRVVKTVDFCHLRALLATPIDDVTRYVEDKLPPELKARFSKDDQRALLEEALAKTKDTRASKELLAKLKGRAIAPRQDQYSLCDDHGTIDWVMWGDLLSIPHEENGYRRPANRHGTHVAGILGADWRPEDLGDDLIVDEVGTPRRRVERKGVCPEIELFDIRVLREDGSADELAIVAALQFVRALNARHDHITIHGVNLSLSIPHEVSNYACGRTPVCEECERLVASGVVVVAAAGNYGRARYVTADEKLDSGYRTVSITDPGNTEAVITVGATHRASPHEFGVSYFSSRGPTGDGRFKPDLVAPGEKVTSTVMMDDTPSEESLDGTSMAAPHVSGAAALLLCRYPELIGRPAEVKRILCKTATDLGRDRYFQGAGLLDILRAMQSF